jgi:hypothetical protein
MFVKSHKVQLVRWANNVSDLSGNPLKKFLLGYLKRFNAGVLSIWGENIKTCVVWYNGARVLTHTHTHTQYALFLWALLINY